MHLTKEAAGIGAALPSMVRLKDVQTAFQSLRIDLMNPKSALNSLWVSLGGKSSDKNIAFLFRCHIIPLI